MVSAGNLDGDCQLLGMLCPSDREEARAAHQLQGLLADPALSCWG